MGAVPVGEVANARRTAVVAQNLPRLYRRMGLSDILEIPRDWQLARAMLMAPAGLPQADLILLRDSLGYFSDYDIRLALRALYASGSRFLLCTTAPRAARSTTTTGEWRPINLEHYNRKRPFLYVDEGVVGECLGLYRLN